MRYVTNGPNVLLFVCLIYAPYSALLIHLVPSTRAHMKYRMRGYFVIPRRYLNGHRLFLAWVPRYVPQRAHVLGVYCQDESIAASGDGGYFRRIW